ncbi:MAG: 16S rRNA (cytosine(1402)-N(4))-methyltransferase RsmH [Alphaproteobacteria bacterium]
MKHIPVLLESVLKTLGDINGKTIIDGTFGAGGYTRALLERGANVIAFDRDSSVIPVAESVSAEFGDKFQFINSPFSEINKLSKSVDVIIFDFGVSSMQIDTPNRGFSWRFDAPLDMRMGDGESATDLIADLSVSEIAKILSDYGDVKKAGPIARAIKEALPQTTFQLRDLIYNPKDVAPVFQALRIAVNDELGQISAALNAVPDLLNVNGICACVTFHSLEDRIVKSKFREWTTPIGDPRFPAAPAPFEMLKTYRPSESELELNPRARSAHLRAVKKIKM